MKTFSRSFTIPLSSIESHNVPEVPSHTKTDSETALFHLKNMLTMRRMEIKSDMLYKQQHIQGFLHLYDGQEAIASGMQRALEYEDPLISAYRIHALAYSRGITLHQIFAEMMGKRGASSKAKGGSMHFYHRAHNLFGGSGIVGAQIPVGVGLGFALKYKGNKDNAAFVLYGDGAANQGQLYEAANMAKL